MVKKPPPFDDCQKKIILAKGITRGTLGLPNEPAAVFSPEDPEVIAYLKCCNFSGDHRLKWEWYDPKGHLYFSSGHFPLFHQGRHLPPGNFYNIFANTPYPYNDNTNQHLYELRSSGNLNAENNWWGGGDVEGYVDVNPSQNSIICDCVPISPPTGFTNTGISGSAVDLTWAANPEGDTAGYKIYYDPAKVDHPYRYVKDVGNTTSYTLTLPGEGTYYITITAGDTSADGEDDLFEGHESWYAKGISVTIGNK